MFESSPTNETNHSIIPRAASGPLTGNGHHPLISPHNYITTSGGQTGTSSLVSRRFSPTAPEFVSGATAHPSRGPVDNTIQGKVSHPSWQGADTGGVLLKPSFTMGMPQEEPVSSLRDLPSAHPQSRRTPCADDLPINFANRGNDTLDDSKNLQNSSSGTLPLQNVSKPPPQDSASQTRAFNAFDNRLLPTNPPRLTQDVRANFDHRYLMEHGIWDYPLRRLQSLSVSPGRRDSDNSGLTNLSASVSCYSSTSDAPRNPVEHANIGTDRGARISDGSHGLPAAYQPDSSQVSSMNNRGSKSKDRGSRFKNRKTGNNTPNDFDPTGRTAALSLTSEHFARTEKPRNGRWNKQAKNRTTTDSRSFREEGVCGIADCQDAPQGVDDDSSKHHQGAEAGNNQESQARDQSLHVLGRKQPLSSASSALEAHQQQPQLTSHTTVDTANFGASIWAQHTVPRPGPANTRASGLQQEPFATRTITGPAIIAASESQQQLVPFYAMTGPVPHDTGAIGGQQQSAAPQPLIGPWNMRASGAQPQSVPHHVRMDPTRHPAVLQSNVPAPSLINGQKYFMKPGFRGSTVIWAYDGISQDQLYLCSMGEDGSVSFIPTSPADHASAQLLTAVSISQQAPFIGPGSSMRSQRPLPDFGPIGSPTIGRSYGPAPAGQIQDQALSHPYVPRVEASQESPLQPPNLAPTWSLPRSPIGAKEWIVPVPEGLQPQSQQGLLYSSPTALKQHIIPHLESSHHARTDSGTTQVCNPPRLQLAGFGTEHERLKENTSFTPTTSRPSVLERHQLPITEIANVSPRASVPRSGTAWLGSAPSPTAMGMSHMTSVSALPLVRYRQFQDMTFSHIQHEHPNAFEDQVMRNGKPSYELARSPEFLPFVEATKMRKPAEWGVIKIGSIPYACTKQEILAFLGKNAKIITPEMGPAIHIMMDRTSGKTLDAYVEFLSHMDAHSFVGRLMFAKEMEHRQLKVADRHITLEVSSQAALMKELFPKAKNVEWNGQVPVISEPGLALPFNSGFKCFISREELLTLAKHAETPQRCNSKSVTRTYENMISILTKFPWFAVKHYTIADRDAIYEAVKKQLSILATAIQKTAYHRAADPEMSPSELTEDLLGDLLRAGLNAPGFSEQQKWRLWQGSLPFSQSIARMSPLSEIWPWLVLSRKPGTEEALVVVYARIHHDGRLSPVGNPAGVGPLFEEGAMMTLGTIDPETSMEEIGAVEWRALDLILRRALE